MGRREAPSFVLRARGCVRLCGGYPPCGRVRCETGVCAWHPCCRMEEYALRVDRLLHAWLCLQCLCVRFAASVCMAIRWAGGRGGRYAANWQRPALSYVRCTPTTMGENRTSTVVCTA